MAFLCNSKSSVSLCDPQKMKKKKKNKHYYPIKLRRFSYAELEASTNGFSPRNLLGKGSHGAVFFATLDGGALTAAVKVPISTASSSAENEIEILSKIRSRQIVNLIGYAVDYSRERKLLLVVEYMPNGSLEDLIHTHPKPPAWSDRVRFALEIAKAVRTLHGLNPPVIHRDIKSSNVLIEKASRSRVSDFGLAIMGHVEDIRALSISPAGTLGYLDPCYVTPANLSTKSDVFSFGILLLEIVSGRRAIDVDFSPPSIVEWALPLIQNGEFRGICDRRIRWPRHLPVVRELAFLAARCVRPTAEKRPCMEEVVDCLERIKKRARQINIWNRLRPRVTRVESSWPLDDIDGEEEEEHVSVPRRQSRRSLSGRSRKVSNLTSVERSFAWIGDEMTRGSHQMGRSKSIGCFREVKVGPDGCVSGMVKSRGRVRVKVSTVRLSKSKSMGALHGGNNAIYRGNMMTPEVDELTVIPLLVNSSTNAHMITVTRVGKLLS
ncbi:hypothetical protein Cgig2_029835 [Carnegiea gigantea]|uniref:Protein kinase domain-containing protein n=1 Tax=Carnegiea gigantea TaxID=171969 RepID=A0A9Q1JMM8_9CARY|nr:hypothetical protein Cgig2_029835 [Carnegiea gigantea]